MANKPMPKSGPRKKQPAVPTEEIQVTKEPGKLQKLFVWVIIPLLFALAMGMIVAEVTGTNVFEKAKTIVGSDSATENDKAGEKSVDDFNKQIVDLKAQVKEQEALTVKLQSQLDSNKADAAKAEVEKARLEKEIQKLQQTKTDTATDSTAVTKTYEQMTPKAAAGAIAVMNEEEALKILRNLKPATLAPILEKMTPEDAAKLTEALSNDKS